MSLCDFADARRRLRAKVEARGRRRATARGIRQIKDRRPTDADYAAITAGGLRRLAYLTPEAFRRWKYIMPCSGASKLRDRFQEEIKRDRGLFVPSEEQLFAMCQEDPTGIRLYDAAVSLSQLLVPDDSKSGFAEVIAELKRGCHVLELGAGFGYLSLEIAKRYSVHGTKVVATDLESMLLDVVLVNSLRLGLPPQSLIVNVLPWGSQRKTDALLQDAGVEAFDVIVAADVLYGDVELVPKLLQSIWDLSWKETRVLVSWEERKAHTDCSAAFLEQAKERFHVDRIDATAEAGWRFPELRIVLLRRKMQ
eukprot:g303.t1